MARKRADAAAAAAEVKRDAARMRTLQQRLHDEDRRAEEEKLRKQRNFQSVLEEQASLVRARKSAERVTMTFEERKMNEGIIREFLEKPERKEELRSLM